MSSNYYGGMAGEEADRGAAAEAAFLEWLDAHTRNPADTSAWDDMHAAFMAGWNLRGEAATPDVSDDFTADRHADLDPGELGMMADADFYDRTSGED